MRRSFTSATSVSLIVLAIAVVYLLTGALPESSASDPLPRLRSDYPLVAGNESTLEYTDARYGYTVGLPAGWRTAPEFMLAFAETNGRPQAGGNAEDYAVFTSLSADAEAQFVQNARSRADELTGLAGWLEFFLLDTVELFPTARDLNSQLSTADQGNVKHLVSAIEQVSLNTSQTATRYTVELISDYGHYVYDRVFVPSSVVGCPECTGFIVSTAIAGRSPAEPSSQPEPPPAAYPAEEFEAIFRSFRLPEGATPTPAKLPDTGGQPSQVEEEFLSFVSEDAGFTIEYPASWSPTPPAASPGAFHVAWLDPQALATPTTRGELSSGAKIDLQAIRGAPTITSADRLVEAGERSHRRAQQIVGHSNRPDAP